MSAPEGSFAVTNRVLRGYGPLAAFAVLLVLMALLVPTRVPEEPTVNAGADPLGAGVTTPVGSGPAASPTQTIGTGTAGGAAAGGVAPSGASTPSGTGGDFTGPAAVPVAAGVQACADRELQVPGDEYSPPCVAWGGGDNGGATHTGVTADSIKVTFRALDEVGFQQTLAEIAGASLSDSPETVRDTVAAMADYFNERFEFYGRNIEIDFYPGQGSNTQELLGKGRDKAEADATEAAARGAFADLSATSEPYADGLARRGVIGFGTPYLSRKWHEDRAPFAWSLSVDGTRVSELAAEYANKQLANKPAVYAGGDLAGQTRKFAILAPENSWYQESVENAQQITESAGNERAVNVKYQLDLATMSSQANNIIPKVKSENVTTIFCGCDPVMPVFLSGVANRENYFPEFIISGTALTDADIVAQLWDQEFAAHAFGISSLEPFVHATQTYAYQAYKSVRPDEEPALTVDLIYYQMYMLAIGIQGAGPNLTPATFEAGMFAYPPRNGQVGLWKFGPGDRTAANDVREVYWDPEAISPFNGKEGAYLGTTGERWEFGQIPARDPQVPVP